MENKNIVLLKHHPMNVKYTNPWYTKQVDDDLSQYVIIDVTSRMERNKDFLKEHPTFLKDTSPFYMGPVVSSDGVKANIFEIFWQCGKVYPCHDEAGRPNADYFTWRNQMYAQTICTKKLMRHANESLGYSHQDTKYFAYYDQEKKDFVPLDYVTSRKKVYIPEYAKLFYGTNTYHFLKRIADSGRKLALVDFDAYNYYSEKSMKLRYQTYLNRCQKEHVLPTLSENDFTKIKDLKAALNCPYLLAGHSFAIKMVLEGDLLVEGNEVKDPLGLLK